MTECISVTKAVALDVMDGNDTFRASLPTVTTLVYGDRAERLVKGERFVFTETVFGPCEPTLDTVFNIRVGMYYTDESDLTSGVYGAFITTSSGHFLIVPAGHEVMVLMDAFTAWDQEEVLVGSIRGDYR